MPAITPHRLAFQATDLARRHREVIDAAREGGALLRDKDGLVLTLAPAADSERRDEIAALALDLVRAMDALEQATDHRTPGAYGGLAWLSVLPEEAQRAFLHEMAGALVTAASGTSLRPVEALLGDWRATAEAWADTETREALLADEAEPLASVEL